MVKPADAARAPFHIELRAAVHRNGLTLERLHQRLADLGAPVSVATLSNWQRGVSRPDSGRSTQAVAALEKVLSLEPGTLTGLLGERRARGPRRTSDHDSSLWAYEQLRMALGAPSDNPADPIVVIEELVIGPERGAWELCSQAVVRSRVNGLARWYYYYTEEEGALPTVRGSVLTEVGRVITDDSINTVAAEFLFPQPLMRGETYPLEYYLDCPSGGAVPSLHGRWMLPGCSVLSMTVVFRGAYRPSSAHQITQLDQTAPVLDVTELPLLGGHTAHFVLRDAEPTFHGIRWEWP